MRNYRLNMTLNITKLLELIAMPKASYKLLNKYHLDTHKVRHYMDLHKNLSPCMNYRLEEIRKLNFKYKFHL